MRVAVASPRSGSIWNRPPLAQSLAWIFMLSPLPVQVDALLVQADRGGGGQTQPAVVGDLAGVGHDPAPTGDVQRVGGAGEGVVVDREVAGG